MSAKISIPVLVMASFFLLITSGCAGEIDTTKERPIASVGANKVYEKSLEREVMRSMQVVKTNRRNDFYGFSPLKVLKMMRANVAYLVQATALVLPAGSLDRAEVAAAAEKEAKATADEVVEKLKAGGDWDELNQKYSVSEHKGNGGKLPPFGRGFTGFPEDFYNLTPGEVLPAFKWSYWGYSVVRLDGKTTGPDGEEQFTASMILIVPDEKAVKTEMINGVLDKKQVEIIDPPLKGFDIFLHGDYDGALAFLGTNLPSQGWPDLGYYVMSLCAEKKGDEEGRLKYLKLADEHVLRFAMLRAYYEIEIGDILLGRNDESGGEYIRRAFDDSPNDMDIVKAALERFKQLGDSEYVAKAGSRLAEMDAYINRSSGGGIPQDDVQTGDVAADKPDFEDL